MQLFSVWVAQLKIILSFVWKWRRDTHMTSRIRQKLDAIGRKRMGVGWGISEFSGRQIFIFFIKEYWISSMTIHHAEPNNILLTKSLLFHSNIWQLRHPLIIPLHCLWAKSNIRTRGQFECDLTWFFFCFDFVHMHHII